MVLEKPFESPVDFKEIKAVIPKGNQPWIFNKKSDADAEAPIFWPPDVKKPTHWKRPWCWERLRAGREGASEDEMVGWHHWHSGNEFEQTLGDNEGQGSLECCSPWDREELSMT